MTKPATKKPYRVLSIDFDFFQDTTVETIQKCYPDGLDLTTRLSEIVWTSKYMSYGYYKGKELLEKVTINQPLFEQIQGIIDKQKKNIPCIIAQSHVHIYPELTSRILPFQKAEIYHIDFHHDMVNGNMEVDCGNWLGKFVEHHPNTDVTWFTRQTALEAYALENIPELPVQFDFESIKDKQFDMVFLCRSDAWLPPHLDVYFDDLILLCSDVFEHVFVNTSVMQPRDIQIIYDNAAMMNEFQQNMINEFHQQRGMQVNADSYSAT